MSRLNSTGPRALRTLPRSLLPAPFVAAGLAVIMFSSSIGAPASGSSSVVFRAPYQFVFSHFVHGSSRSGCGRTGFTAPPSWSRSSGRLDASMRAHLSSLDPPNCAAATYTPGSDMFTLAYEVAYFDLNFSSNGSHSIKVYWVLNGSLSSGLVPFRGCHLNYSVYYSACYVSATAGVYTLAVLTDLSNSGWGGYIPYDYSNNIDVENRTTVSNLSRGGISSNSTFGGSGTTVLNVRESNVINCTNNFAIIARDHYQIEIYVQAYTSLRINVTSATAFGKASTNASITPGASGQLLKLSRIVIT